MDYRKSHNFDSNIIARNLADFGDEFSDDSVSLDLGSDEDEFEEEEEVELDELERESLAAHSGVGGKRPSRALEQLMLGIDLGEQIIEEEPVLVAPKRKLKSKSSSDKTSRDPHDKAAEAHTLLMQATKAPSKRENGGRASLEGKIDEIASKSQGSKKPTAASPPSKPDVSPTKAARRGKRSDVAKSSNEPHRARHHAASPHMSPGRRPRAMQRRAVSDANVTHTRRTGSIQQRSMQQRSNSSSDVNTNKGGAQQPRSASMQHVSAADEKTQSHQHGHHHHVRRKLGHRSSSRSDEDEEGTDASGGNRASTHSRRRHMRNAHHNSEHSLESGAANADSSKPEDPIPRGSGHGHSRRRHMRNAHHNSEHSLEGAAGAGDSKPEDPIPRGSGHNRRRQLRSAHNNSEHSLEGAAATTSADSNEDPIPRGSGHGSGRRRQVKASGGSERRRVNHNAPRSPLRQTPAARRVPKQAHQQHHQQHDQHHKEVNAAVLGGEGTGLKW